MKWVGESAFLCNLSKNTVSWGTSCMTLSFRPRAETRSSQAATQCGRSQRAPCVPGRAGWRMSIPATFFKEYSASSNHGEAQDEDNVAEQDDEENADEEELAANTDIVLRDNDNLCLPGRMHVRSASMPLLCDRVTGLKGYRTQRLLQGSSVTGNSHIPM